MNTFLFDLDGVIYRDRDRVPFAAEAIAVLRAAGHRILFATNNATRSREEFAERIGEVGVAARPEDIATSASATAEYLRTLPAPPRTALVVGSEALITELDAAGIRAVDAAIESDDQPDVVVASLDRGFTYQKLARVQQAVLRGAPLVATNRDPQFPGANGRIWPGAGAIVAAVEAACRRSALLIGKPGSLLYKSLLSATGADPAHTVVVGDSLVTDSPAATAMGLASVLVLTGVTTRAELATSSIKPTIVLDNLAELAAIDPNTLLQSLSG
jgi:phosphoglycolate/pyridoxal phosphate phosphatase family enzyme